MTSVLYVENKFSLVVTHTIYTTQTPHQQDWPIAIAHEYVALTVVNPLRLG